MKVYLPQDMDAAGKEYLIERGYEIKMGTGTTPEIMAKEIVDCDAVIVRVAQFPASVINAAPKLKVIGRHGVGTDNIDVAAATARGIRVTNGPYSNTESVAEHAAGMILALAHRIPLLNDAVREGNWGIRNSPIGMSDIKGKTLGLVGSGRIALSLAEKMHFGFGMKVITYGTRHPERLPEYVTMAASLESLFAEADVVSLHCPLTEETRLMVNAELLNRMKPTALLVNTARGEVVDEMALYEALKNKKITGAAADVAAGEVMDKNHPLLTLDNFIVSPHCASHTREGKINMAVHAAMGVDEVLSGKEPTWPVN
ncbi:MAG: hydroxyacid dehydrogenase [Clostridia bacterium]|nr:hydroxyacid dehydrogenase [Clostridia bacterium]